ncbi:tetratricopeptide repeat protein [Luteolibacter algae]|uniref:Tetratricopeptide repeat protein n=1 Tax=Luteolibacter algae TaxID=454151 RepID=A0ABW5D674_9BACT
MSNHTGLKLAFLSLVLAGFSHAAEPLPLSTSYWNDPTFLKSFNGTYRIEARIEPTLTTEERGLLVEIQELMGDEKRTLSLEKLKSSALTAKSAALTFNLGNLYFETGDTGKAIEAYKNALKAYPSFRRAHHNLALALVRENQLEEALTHLTEAIRLGDSEGNTYGLLGYCRIAREEWASALQAYRLAQITEPDVAEWKAGIAQCLQNLDEKAEAVALLDEVIRQRPTEASYSVLQANILMDLDQPEAAVKALELPYRLKILDPNATLLLAELHLRGDRTEAAEQAVTAAFSDEKMQPAIPSILRLITAASTRSEWNMVKGLLKKAETDAPVRALRLAEAGYLIASGENPASGADLLKKLTEEEPTDGEALIALARYQSTNGQPDSAELLYERATADTTHAYEAHVELVRLHVAQSRYADALKSVDRALELNPTDSLRNYRQSLLKTIAASE